MTVLFYFRLWFYIWKGRFGLKKVSHKGNRLPVKAFLIWVEVFTTFPSCSDETTDFYGVCYFALHIVWPASCFGLLSRSVLIGSLVAGPYRLGVVTRNEGRVDPSVLRRWITGKAGRSWIRWTRAKLVMKHFRRVPFIYIWLCHELTAFLHECLIFGAGIGWTF